MNFSVSHLSLASLSRSPYFSQKHSFSANFIHAKRCFSPFFYNKGFSKFSVSKSSFDSQLSPAIIIEKDAYMIGKQYEYKRQEFLKEPIKIVNSVFTGFNCDNELGGAFLVAYGLRMYNVIFKGLIAKSGGCFCAGSDVLGSFITFRECESREVGGAFFVNETKGENSFKFEFSTFKNTKSEKCGAFSRLSDGKFTVQNCNFTKCNSHDTAIFLARCEDCLVTYNNFFRCGSSGPNGGIVLSQPSSSLLVSYNNFNLLTQSNRRGVSAAALMLDRPLDGTIERCNFLKNVGLKTICLNDGGPINIKSCKFSGKESSELYAKDGEFVKSGCSFGGASLVVIKENEDLGYRPNRPFTPEEGGKRVFGKGVSETIVNANKAIAWILLCSIVFGIILYSLGKKIASTVYNKKPRAFD